MKSYIDFTYTLKDSVVNALSLCAFTTLFIVFTVFTVLSVLRKDFSKNKIYFYFIEGGEGIAYLGLLFLLEKSLFYMLVYCGYAVVLASVLPTLRCLKKQKSEKKVIEYIPKKAENVSTARRSVSGNARRFLEKIKCKEKEGEKAKDGIDFSHVISILNKLGRFGLSDEDSRIIEELKETLSKAREGDDSLETRSKINDGLSALLKIMAKYSL